MKNKALTLTLIFLVSLTLIGMIGMFYYFQYDKKEPSANPTIDEILEASVDVEEITTNLAGKQFIRISLKIQTNSKQAAKELSKRDFQVKNMIIQELSEMTSADLEGKSGKQKFEEAVRAQINALMQSGEVQKVYIVSSMIQ
ncbi:flagellar basal body-associated protein FliL [Sporosarcina sp. HYO08]|uniref:flagellar basal body-associated protein FliL n=1 Tax=Sporosarcina sp. HYO08 TaxID=1759557 RepID=UPI000796D867|nr:flagellar basal body-associated protein FliL [Sporosarcina sp. HYO08]KXH79988.1 flagellar basal body-associated protein FliL [Sporosarcina sp. HYO08]